MGAEHNFIKLCLSSNLLAILYLRPHGVAQPCQPQGEAPGSQPKSYRRGGAEQSLDTLQKRHLSISKRLQSQIHNVSFTKNSQILSVHNSFGRNVLPSQKQS